MSETIGKKKGGMGVKDCPQLSDTMQGFKTPWQVQKETLAPAMLCTSNALRALENTAANDSPQ